MSATVRQTPGFKVLYRLGVEWSPQLEHLATLQEVADELGITKQNAYTESVLALGKLIWLLRKRLNVTV